MIETVNAGLRNTLSALVPVSVKHFLVTKLLFGPSTGRMLRLIGPEKNLKGLRFDLSSDIIPDGEIADIFFNRRERAELDFVRRYLIGSDIVNIVELGASIGFIGANIIFEKKVNYFGIEASQRLCHEATINLQHNNRSGSFYRIENLCIDYSGRAEVGFAESRSSLAGRIDRLDSTLRVKTVRFGDLVRRHGLRKFALITDVEGAEADIFFQDADSLQDCRLIVAELEDSGQVSIDDQVRRLAEIGFAVQEQFRNVFAFQRQG